MIISGYPIGIRHILRIASDQVRHVIHRRRHKPSTKINFVYFSCAKDISLLTISLKSLAALKCDSIGAIFVIEDTKGPFDDDQKSLLKGIIQNLEFVQLGKIDWASIDTIKTELTAFSMAAKKSHPNDFIAKIDSDILFFSPNKLKEISVCDSDFIGDGHYSNYKYAQGGLYMIRAPLAASLSDASDNELTRTIEACGTIAEDQVVSALIRNRTKKVWLTRIMLFPNEYERTDLKNNCVRRDFSAIHFVHKKPDMHAYFYQLFSWLGHQSNIKER